MSALLHIHPVPARALAALRPACVARLSASAVNNNTPPAGREPDKRAFAVAFWAALGALLSTPVVAVRYHLNDWCSVERSRGRLG
ncbi:hypothetical protein DFH11DRAFT_1642917 [Phellopilus nigrolimitatus]|nr:hypothetical protein DFH11DRAFT_1642917 [Phellopilus nigrolimitatus]